MNPAVAGKPGLSLQQQLAPSPTNQRRQTAPVMSKPVMLPPSKTVRPDPHRSALRPDGPVWKEAPELNYFTVFFYFLSFPDIPTLPQAQSVADWHRGATSHICHTEWLKTDFRVKDSETKDENIDFKSKWLVSSFMQHFFQAVK